MTITSQPGGDSSSIFGRQAELERMASLAKETVDAADRGSGKLVLLAGNSGVGKSALAEAFLAMAQELGFDVFRTACEPFHEGMSFFPIREIVRQLSAGRSTVEVLADYFGSTSSQVDMAGVSESSNVDALSRREAIVATFSNIIFGRLQDTGRPLIAFIDDLEHLDAGSADALICLIARISEGPVIILGAYRTDAVIDPSHPLKTVATSARRTDGALLSIGLDGFELSALPALTEAVLGGECDLPLAFYDKLERETEGNPLFIREVLRTLQEPSGGPGSSPLVLRAGKWRFDGSIELWAIPASVEDVIAARLDLLDSSQRRELELAAVIGRRFAFEVLCQLMASREDELLDHLDEFLDFDLIRELSHNDESFEFSHGKIRDVLYDSLSGLRRRRMHAQVAEVLQQLHGITSEDWDALIGEHLYLAAKHEIAFDFLLRASRSARRTGSAREAVSLFRKALETSDGAVLGPDDSKHTIQLELAEGLIATSETDEAGVLLEQLTRVGVDDRVRGWALNYLGDALLLDGDIDQAIDAYNDCEQMARQVDDAELIAEVCCDLGELHNRMYERRLGTDPQRAAEHRVQYERYTTEAHKLVDQIGRSETKARILRNVAKRSRTDGDLDGALDLYEQSLAVADSRAGGHRFLIPYAKTLRLAGRPAEATEAVERVLKWSSQVGSRRSEAIARQYRGLLLMTAGDDPESLNLSFECLREALRQHRLIGFSQGLHETEMLLGEVSLRRGDLPSAIEYLQRAVDEQVAETPDLLRAVATELEANGEKDRADFVLDYAMSEL